MDLKGLLAGSDRIDMIEIISFSVFPPILLPPRFVGLIGLDGRSIYLTTEMRDVHERLEVGVLKFWEKGDPSESGKKVSLSGGRVLSWTYLAAPGFDFISGVRIGFDNGDLIVTAGATPLSVFVSFGEFRIEDPEFPIDEYRAIEKIDRVSGADTTVIR